MNDSMQKILNSKAINGWGLFWLVSIPISAAVVVEMLATDMSGGAGVSHMIGYAVRWAVPFIFLTVAASSVHTLFPGPFTTWWRRNRKHLGLCFAVAMAWQGLFIFIVSTTYRDYYFAEIYYFRDELEGTVGYLFLAAMVFTSFKFGRQLISASQWKLIHRCGLYFLWAYPFSVYWWNLFYYPMLDPFTEPRGLDYVLYFCGFAAFALRIAAWGKQRAIAARKLAGFENAPAWRKYLGAGIIALGLLAAVTGHLWQTTASAFLMGWAPSAEAELWLPFWPFVPFLPLFILGLGTMLVTHHANAQQQPSAQLS